MDNQEEDLYNDYGFKQYNEIIPPNQDGTGGLYLGQLEFIYSNQVERLKIGAVLSIIGFTVTIDSNRNVKHLFIKAEDDEDQEIRNKFKMSNDFIHENLKKTNVYVHCQMGISRSSSLVIAYLMKERQMSYVDALQFVRSKRKYVCPNEGFEMQLREYDEELQHSRELLKKK